MRIYIVIKIFAALSLCLCFWSCNKKPNLVTVASKVTVEKKDTTKPKLTLTKKFILGKFDYKTDTTFVKVDAQYSSKTIYLKKEAYLAFLKMHSEALDNNIDLKIVSGTRNFDEQKRIWEQKWKKYNTLKPKARVLKILEYSSMPSTSRHHWGTDIDLISLSNSYFETGRGLKTYNWLVENANRFGFYQVYTNKSNGRTGYNLERWHWSYMPLAKSYLTFYNSSITLSDISGFLGSEYAKEAAVIKNYVNGISVKAKNY